MQQTEITASPRLRAAFFLVAVILFALWGWSLVPAIHGWNNPHEDGFSFTPVFYATILLLPLGLMLLAGGGSQATANASSAPAARSPSGSLCLC